MNDVREWASEDPNPLIRYVLNKSGQYIIFNNTKENHILSFKDVFYVICKLMSTTFFFFFRTTIYNKFCDWAMILTKLFVSLKRVEFNLKNKGLERARIEFSAKTFFIESNWIENFYPKDQEFAYSPFYVRNTYYRYRYVTIGLNCVTNSQMFCTMG